MSEFFSQEGTLRKVLETMTSVTWKQNTWLKDLPYIVKLKALKISNNILKSILNSTGSQYSYNKNDILSLVLGSYSKRAAHYALLCLEVM